MSRPLREISPTGIYHVMLRGVNKQRIFEDLEDYNAFIRIIRKSQSTDKFGNEVDTPNFDLYAYCLMDNHVHLLFGTREISISDVVKRIASTYARVFNEKYERVGHFFQDRFRSVCCVDEQYFYRLITYIHENPVEGGLCKNLDEYAFSSFNELTGYYDHLEHSYKYKLCDLSNIQERISTITPQLIREHLLRVHRNQLLYNEAHENAPQDNESHPCNYETTDYDEYLAHMPEILFYRLEQAVKNKAERTIIDDLVVENLLIISDAISITDFQRLDKTTMRMALARIRAAGVSIRELSRISGISVGIIRNCTLVSDTKLHSI